MPPAYSSSAGSMRRRGDLFVGAAGLLLGHDRRLAQGAPDALVDPADRFAGQHRREGARWYVVAALREELGHAVLLARHEHREVRGRGARRQGVFERAFELLAMRVAEHVVDDGARPAALDGHGHAHPNEVELVARADVHPGDPRSVLAAAPLTGRQHRCGSFAWRLAGSGLTSQALPAAPPTAEPAAGTAAESDGRVPLVAVERGLDRVGLRLVDHLGFGDLGLLDLFLEDLLLQDLGLRLGLLDLDRAGRPAALRRGPPDGDGAEDGEGEDRRVQTSGADDRHRDSSSGGVGTPGRNGPAPREFSQYLRGTAGRSDSIAVDFSTRTCGRRSFSSSPSR